MAKYDPKGNETQTFALNLHMGVLYFRKRNFTFYHHGPLRIKTLPNAKDHFTETASPRSGR